MDTPTADLPMDARRSFEWLGGIREFLLLFRPDLNETILQKGGIRRWTS
jgi:hypothetical protein